MLTCFVYFYFNCSAVVSSEGGNPILDSLKSKMKEMNIDKERLDRSSSVSSDQKGKYLSQTSKESAGNILLQFCLRM